MIKAFGTTVDWSFRVIATAREALRLTFSIKYEMKTCIDLAARAATSLELSSSATASQGPDSKVTCTMYMYRRGLVEPQSDLVLRRFVQQTQTRTQVSAAASAEIVASKSGMLSEESAMHVVRTRARLLFEVEQRQ